MTNRAQAKPTNDPKDPIQRQSLLMPALISAGIVLLSVVWMIVDDLVWTKPWVHYQSEYQSVALEFLGEELSGLNQETLANDGGQRALLEKAYEQVNQLSHEEINKKITFISKNLEDIDTQLDALAGKTGDEYWLKEQRSIAGARRYKHEHDFFESSEEVKNSYYAMLKEIEKRNQLITSLRLRQTQLKNREPNLKLALSSIQAKIYALTGDLDSLRQTFASFDAFKVDFVQRYKNHGGSGDIVDRCESCHRGSNEVYLDRSKMWSSHLSNDKGRSFFKEHQDFDFWEHNQDRLEEVISLAYLNNDFGGPDSFFVEEPEESDPFRSLSIPSLRELENFAQQKLAKAGKQEQEELLVIWNSKQMWRGNSLFSPLRLDELESEEENKDSVASYEPNETMVELADDFYDSGYDPLNYEDGTVPAKLEQELPDYFLSTEVFIYLACKGPYRLDGIQEYPDRFDLARRTWFQEIVNDVRVKEIYKLSYRRFSKHIKERLLMFTAHPRHDELIAGHHESKDFGCMSCHRGFGINTKSVRSAHGNQAHWLTPLFKEGYQEAGCQKCHKQEIELASTTRIQQGKDLYQKLGCWGCHAYEGYESEATKKLKVEKNLRDTHSELDKLQKQLLQKQNSYAESYEGSGFAQLVGSLGVAEASKRKEQALNNLEASERDLLRLQVEHQGVQNRLHELDIEHKKRGPNLKEVASKLSTKAWLANWIRYPKGWRPSTSMPHFFYGPFAFVDDKKVMEAGGDWKEAFDPDPDGKHGNSLYRRLNQENVKVLKMISSHIWQSSRVAQDMGDARTPDQHNIPVNDPEAIDKGRLLFTTRGCMGCHSIEPDLVKGKTTIPMLVEQDGDLEVELQTKEEWVSAPKYRYRVDGEVARDGHGNPLKNEYIYSHAANLSRVGEKAQPDYLFEWILQPRLRNKHSIMPSFWATIAGTPEGPARTKLDQSIERLELEMRVHSGKPPLALRLRLSDEKRKRGDLDPQSLALYTEVLAEGKTLQDQNSQVMLRELEEVFKAVEQARYITAFLSSLKHESLYDSAKPALENFQNPLNGHIGDYQYSDFVWKDQSTLDDDDINADFGLEKSANPQGSFEAEKVNVKGFGDYSFMDLGYQDYLLACKVQKKSQELISSADKLLQRITELMGHNSADARTLASNEIEEFSKAYGNSQELFNSLQRVNLEPSNKGLIFETERDRKGLRSSIQYAGNLFGDLGFSLPKDLTTTASLTQAAHQLASVSDTLSQIHLAAKDLEQATYAGKGKAYTSFYGCGGCHEIGGLENEGKIGVELTEEGSKFIQRLDFGLLHQHPMPSDPSYSQLDSYNLPESDHTPQSPIWVSRGSLRPSDFAYQLPGLSNGHTSKTPEDLAYARGGVGFEMPSGMRQRYIHSKYDYHTRHAWFKGKLHHPRQWDKGRLIGHKGAWFERTRMPLFELNEDDLLAITAFIEGSENMVPWGAGADPLPPSFEYNFDGAHDTKVEGWWILKKYNCLGCHSMGPYEGRYRRLSNASYGAFLDAHYNPDGNSIQKIKLVDDVLNTPPVLYDVGSRLEEDWLVRWLQKPWEVRNMTYTDTSGLKQAYPGQYNVEGAVQQRVIMPHFYLTAHEAKALQGFFASQTEAKEPLTVGKEATPESIEYGEKIFLSGDCLQCHSIDDAQAGYYQPGGKAPNLRPVPERANREWVRKWLRNPDALQPRGRMYHFFEYDIVSNRWVMKADVNGQDYRPRQVLGDKNTPLVDYQGDHINALVDFLYEGLPNRSTQALKQEIETIKTR